MPHTRPDVASKRFLQFRARAAELRRIASSADKQRRAMAPRPAQTFEQIVEAAERGSQEPDPPGSRAGTELGASREHES